MSKYILIFNKTIHLCGWFGKAIGPFDTIDEALAYLRNAQSTWMDQDALAGCVIEPIISPET